MVGGLPGQDFSVLPVPVLLPHPGQASNALPGLGPFSGLSQEQRHASVVVFGGAVAEVVGPLQAVPVFGCPGEVMQVVGVGEMDVGGVPEEGGRAQRAAGGAAVLFEVVGEAEYRSRWPR
ncbi:hypothetical protein L1856_05560 [Streptomyces sp. Tue 6430]|nr:hypothetical protein [Streptomyces sp. Tue 6430]